MTLVVVAVLFLAGCATTSYVAMTETTVDYIVTVDFVNKPLVASENTLLVTIKDQSGKTITDATVQVAYYMTEKRIASRGYISMPAHGSNAAGQAKDAAYNIKLNFTMTGPWYIEVLITRDGKEQTAKFLTTVQ
jgi:hypothetical protein